MYSIRNLSYLQYGGTENFLANNEITGCTRCSINIIDTDTAQSGLMRLYHCPGNKTILNKDNCVHFQLFRRRFNVRVFLVWRGFLRPFIQTTFPITTFFITWLTSVDSGALSILSTLVAYHCEPSVQLESLFAMRKLNTKYKRNILMKVCTYCTCNPSVHLILYAHMTYSNDRMKGCDIMAQH